MGPAATDHIFLIILLIILLNVVVGSPLAIAILLKKIKNIDLALILNVRTNASYV